MTTLLLTVRVAMKMDTGAGKTTVMGCRSPGTRWTPCAIQVASFSLMDAIECGIVKLPRVPVADKLPTGAMRTYYDLWDHIGGPMRKKGRSKGGVLDPINLASKQQTALFALYGHYEKAFALWQQEGISVPPVFIVVCNNTATSIVEHRAAIIHVLTEDSGAAFPENAQCAEKAQPRVHTH